MTIEELKTSMDPRGGVIKIKHVLNRTVTFWPLSIEETNAHYNLNGWWIVNQLDEPVVQETIKIKKDDLAHWNIA